MFSSTHGSQCDSEYNYIPGYIIQDESIGTLEAVDSEILGDYDAYCLYADEALASQDCYARYLKYAEHKEQNEMLERRLDSLEDIKSW